MREPPSTTVKGMTTHDVLEWMKNNPNKSIYVMVRANIGSSVPCKIDRMQCMRFCSSDNFSVSHNFMQTRIDADGHLFIGL